MGSSAQAEELSIRPGFLVYGEYSTNPTYEQHRRDAIADYALRYRPNLTLESNGPAGHVRLNGGVDGRNYDELNELNGHDLFAEFDIDRKLNNRWTLFGTGSYTAYEKRDPVTVGETLLQSERVDLDQAIAQMGLRYSVTAQSTLSGSYAYANYDFEDPSTGQPRDRDFTSNLGSLTYTYALSARDSLFVQGAYRRTEFDPAGQQIPPFPFRPDQEDDQWSALAGWSRQWTPIWSSSLSGGSRWLRSESGISARLIGGGAGVIIPGSSGRSTAFVGNAYLRRVTERSNFELTFKQETRPSSGISASVDDRELGAFYWTKLTRRLSLTLRGSYALREASASSADEAKIQRFASTLEWRVRKRTAIFLRYNFVASDTDNVFFQEYTENRVQLGLRYAFDLDHMHPF